MPNQYTQNPAPVEQRFWSHVKRSDLFGCWMWLGSKTTTGYGRFFLTHSKPVSSHRLSYELVRGSIPDGLTIDHLCNHPSCVNPSHLRAVTQRENLLRSNSLTTLNLQKTHCKQGHAFTPENTCKDRNGRGCRACHRIREQRRYHNRRLAGGVLSQTI